MVLSTTKKCQAIQSITNNTCILGGPKKGGLITMQGRNPNLGAAITSRAPYCCVQTNLGCIAGLAYLRANNLMTMNPQCSGGVPHRMYRGCRSSDSSGSSASPSTDVELSSIATQGPANTWTLNASTTIGAGYTLTIPSGTTLIIPVGMTLTVNGTLVNNGTLTVNGTLVNNNNTIINNLIIHNNGAIINNAGGNIANNAGATINSNSGSRFTNNGAINNNGIMMKNSGSTFTNNAVITNLGVLARAANSILANYGTIGPKNVLTQIELTSIATNVAGIWYMNADYTIAPGYALTIPPAGIVFNTNYNNIINNGSIIIDTNGTLVASGYLDNYGTISIGVISSLTIGGSTLTNHTGGTINNSGGYIVATSGFNNYGGIINNIAGSTITISAPCIFNNESNIVNNGLIQNYGGTVNNSGSIAPNPVQNA
jgi:hypothetical protein